MTERQKSLKEEIMRISDSLHFGIYDNSEDWFYTFFKRASDTYLSNTDSTGMIYKNWLKISRMYLSENFIEEFKDYLFLNIIKNNSVCKSSNR